MSRDKVRPIRLSKEEDDLIAEAAKNDQRAVADYMRIAALDRARGKPTKKPRPSKKGTK